MKPFIHHHIVGIGRSGTTLLQSILNVHTAVWAGPENYFIPFFYYAWKDKTEFTAKDLRKLIRFHRAFEVLQPHPGFRFDEEKFLSLQSTYTHFNALIEGTYRAYIDENAPEKEASCFINKNPIHSLYATELHALNRGSKFVWMVRDYRANVHSRKKSVHLKSDNVYENALRWNAFEAKLSRFAQRHPENILIVTYEMLVRLPEETLLTITRFLGLSPLQDFQQALRPYQKTYTEEIDAHYSTANRMKKRFGDLAQPIHAGAIDQWQQGLTRKEVEICEVLSGKAGVKYGYHTRAKVPSARRVLIQFNAMFFRIKLGITHGKDALFNSLPIDFKVAYFAWWVKRIDTKRKRHVGSQAT